MFARETSASSRLTCVASTRRVCDVADHIPRRTTCCDTRQPLPATPKADGQTETSRNFQHDPFVSPTIRGHRMGRSDRVAMTTFAVNLSSRMSVDCIVARQCDWTFGNPMLQSERDQHPRQFPCRPTSFRKHTMITGSDSTCDVDAAPVTGEPMPVPKVGVLDLPYNWRSRQSETHRFHE